jgi:hypothetical protein
MLACGFRPSSVDESAPSGRKNDRSPSQKIVPPVFFFSP